MLPDQRKLGSVDANHSEFVNLAQLRDSEATWHVVQLIPAHFAKSPEIEQRQANHLKCVITK